MDEPGEGETSRARSVDQYKNFSSARSVPSKQVSKLKAHCMVWPLVFVPVFAP
jgi:hypothetical protein